MTIRRTFPAPRPLRLHLLLASLALFAAAVPTVGMLGVSPSSASVPLESERSVTFEVSGSQGEGAEGGRGAVIRATTSLSPGSTVIVMVGSPGYNGGGPATTDLASGTGAAGGGASDLRIGGDTLAHRVLVAAGGGSAQSGFAGGVGAATGVGGAGAGTSPGYGGMGGSATSGGAGGGCSGTTPGESGSLGLGGMGGFHFTRRGGRTGAGGSGGGGWYGGGGGGFCPGGGGGGSSYVDATVFPNGTDSAIDGARSGVGSVRVSLDCGVTWSTTFDSTESAQTYTVPAGAADPTVTTVSPSAGLTSGGTVVSITGAELGGTTAITFGTTPAASFTVDSATQITATAPSLPAGPHDVVAVTNGCDAVAAGAFHAYAAPVVASVSPNTGSTGGGDTVVLSGTDLDDVDDVTFGTIPAASFTVDSATQITAVSPAGVVGTVAVNVSSPGNAGTGSGIYTFVADPATTPNVAPPITNTRALTGEYAGTSGLDGSIARLYMATFGRQPDPAGHAYWVSRASGGASLSAIAHEFWASAEFAERYGNLDNTDFVDQLYANVLGRAGDAGGVAYWNRVLESGVERAAVNLAFSESAEFRAITGAS